MNFSIIGISLLFLFIILLEETIYFCINRYAFGPNRPGKWAKTITTVMALIKRRAKPDKSPL